MKEGKKKTGTGYRKYLLVVYLFKFSPPRLLLFIIGETSKDKCAATYPSDFVGSDLLKRRLKSLRRDMERT